MKLWPFYSADDLRGMYPAGRADGRARRLARIWAVVFALGLFPRRWVTLEVPGRKTGRLTRFPLGMAEAGGCWYLVPMLGEQSNWVQNARAAGGLVTIRRGRPVTCRLAELPVGERAPILKRYLTQVPGARPHIPVSKDASIPEFEAIASRYPVFRVERCQAEHAARPARAAALRRPEPAEEDVV